MCVRTGATDTRAHALLGFFQQFLSVLILCVRCDSVIHQLGMSQELEIKQ